MTTTKIRIQKWISNLGIASRRQAEAWIQEQRIEVNGELVEELGFLVDPENDRLTIDGKGVNKPSAPRVYWLFHKPDQCLTAREDLRGRPTIFDLPKLRGLPFVVSPVGRLDFRTEGLLLMSNDGELVNRLTHPRFQVPRSYHALVNGKLTKEQEREIRRGLVLKDGPVPNVKIRGIQRQNMGATPGHWYDITVKEGRNRLVRRLFEYFDLKVVRLVRYRYGELELPSDLPAGQYRQLTPEQLETLKKATGLDAGHRDKRQSDRPRKKT